MNASTQQDGATSPDSGPLDPGQVARFCQQLAEIDGFCSRIKAGKDAQSDDDFCIVTRVSPGPFSLMLDLAD